MNNKNYLSRIARFNNNYFPNSKTSKKSLLSILEEGGKIFLKSKNKKIVGYLILQRKDEAYSIAYVGIMRDFRRKGIASSLIKKVIKYVAGRGEGVGFLFTYCSIYNTPSINMLIKNGFKVESISTRWINLVY